MLYQYTDVNAVKSIFETNEIWMTNIQYVNDKQEFTLGLKYLLDAYRTRYRFPEGVPGLCQQCISSGLSTLDHESKLMQGILNALFISSFSQSANVLSQWRGYGKYSIGFDKKIMIDASKSDLKGSLLHLECKYFKNDEEALSYAHEILDSVIIPRFINKWVNDIDILKELWGELMELTCTYALTFKHNSFFEESESRWIYLNVDNVDEIRFRVRNNILIPYVAIKFPVEAIKNVTVGPMEHQDLAANSLDLYANRLIWDKPDSFKTPFGKQFDIIKSDIPFRSI